MSDHSKKPRIMYNVMIGIFISFNLILLSILYINGTNWEFSRYGLISILTPYYWISVLLFVMFYIRILFTKSTYNTFFHILPILLFIIILFGTPTLIEGTPRFGFTFRGGGIVDYIVRTGHITMNYSEIGLLSMYQNWPAMFLLGSIIHLITELSINNILIYTPIVSQFFYMIPLYIIFNEIFYNDKRQIFFACSLFFAANWINQDFFSGQNIGYFYCFFTLSIFLVMISKYQDDLMERPRNIYMFSFLFILSYASTVIGHGLSSIAIFLYVSGYMVVLLILSKMNTNRNFLNLSRTVNLILLTAMILNIWALYGVSHRLFTKGVTKISETSFINLITHFEKTTNLSPDTVEKIDYMPQLKIIYALVFLSISLVILIISIYNIHNDILLISNPIVLCIVILVSNLVLYLTNFYGAEAIIRAYFFSLIILSFLTTLALNMRYGKYVVIMFLLLSVPSHMILHYSNELIYYQPKSSISCMNFLYQNSIDGSIILGYGLLDSSTNFEKYIRRSLTLETIEDVRPSISTYVPMYTSLTNLGCTYEEILNKNYNKIYSSQRDDNLYHANGRGDPI